MTRDAKPFPLAVPAVEAVPLPALDGDDDAPSRQCGRCRLMFQADPALDIRARREWWLCPECESKLLPGRAKKSNVIPFPGPR
jgi:hypothetical protein